MSSMGVASMVDHHFAKGLSLHTDSSRNGYGILQGQDWLAGYFNVDLNPLGYDSIDQEHAHWCNLVFDQDLHINVLELIPIWMAVQRYGPSWHGRQIHCFSDNTQVVSCLNTGKSSNAFSMNLLRDIFWFSVYYNFHLVGKYIKGELNILPDLLSRIFKFNDLSMICGNNLCCRCA